MINLIHQPSKNKTVQTSRTINDTIKHSSITLISSYFKIILIYFLIINIVDSIRYANASLSNNTQTKPTNIFVETTKKKCSTIESNSFFDEINMDDTLFDLKYSCAPLFFPNQQYSTYKQHESCSAPIDTNVIDIIARVLTINDLRALNETCMNFLKPDNDSSKAIRNLHAYKHDFCGNIFKNSYSENYLKKYLFGAFVINQDYYFDDDEIEDSNIDYLVPNLNYEDDDIDSEREKATHFSSKKKYISNDESLNLTVINAIKSLSNCTLVLLKNFFAAQSAECEYIKFLELIEHYDCKTTNFSVKTNCDMCRVCLYAE